MEIRGGPAAYSGRADEPSPAGNGGALRRPEVSIFCAPTPSSPPDNRLLGVARPYGRRVNEALARFLRSRANEAGSGFECCGDRNVGGAVRWQVRGDAAGRISATLRASTSGCKLPFLE